MTLDVVLRNPGSAFDVPLRATSTFYTMVGSPTGWIWKKALINVDTVRKSFSGDTLSWDWNTFTFGNTYHPSSSNDSTAPLSWNITAGA